MPPQNPYPSPNDPRQEPPQPDADLVPTYSSQPISPPEQQPQPQQLQPPLNPQDWFNPPAANSPGAIGTYPTYNQPIYQSRPHRSKKIWFVSIMLLILVALGGGAYAYISMRATPEKVFAGAVSRSLSTQSVTQTLKTSEGSMLIKYDFANASDPRAYTATSLSILGTNFKLQQYGTFQNTFVNYEQYASLFDTGSALRAYQNTWMQSRKDGSPVTNDPYGVDVLFPDPYLQLFGDWIFGDFSKQDKEDLTHLILDNKMYKYDPTKVTQSKIEGEAVYVYDITYNSEERKALNKKAAAIWGQDYSKIADKIELASEAQRAKLYIEIASKELIKVDATGAYSSGTVMYTDYDNTTLPKQPQPKADYVKFVTAAKNAEANQR